MTQRVALPYFGLDPLPWARPALTDFSWINQSSGTTNASATDLTLGRPLLLRGAADADNVCPTFLLKDVPAGSSWTITTMQGSWHSCLANDGNSPSVWNYPIVLRDSGTDKIVTFGWYAQASPETKSRLIVNKRNETTPSADYGTDVSLISLPFSGYVLWFRVSFSSGTLTFSFSPEGQLWEEFAAAGASGFLASIDQVGFGIDRGFGLVSPGFVSALLWSWVES